MLLRVGGVQLLPAVSPALGEGMGQRVGLGLDSPQLVIEGLGNEVNSLVPALASRPAVPQPDTLDETPILRVVLQKPFADALELASAPVFVRAETAKQLRE